MKARTSVAVLAVVATSFGIALTTTSAGAVGPHQHQVTNPAGTHDIARGFCNGDFAEGQTQNVALANFHFMIHIGPLGPENGVVGIGAVGCAP